METDKIRYYTDILLWLFVLHTSGVAIGLMFLPSEYLNLFGLLDYQGRFFQVQAGVFHLVMGLAYVLTIYYRDSAPSLVFFCVIAKSIAVVFLVTYYFFVEQSCIILISAFGDGFLGLTLLVLYGQYMRRDDRIKIKTVPR